MVAAIPEGLLDPMAVAAGKLAVREPRPADAVPGRLDFASVWYPELPASPDALAERWAQPRVVVAPYKPDAAPSAA